MPSYLSFVTSFLAIMIMFKVTLEMLHIIVNCSLIDVIHEFSL